jgi:hypothetical protein
VCDCGNSTTARIDVLGTGAKRSCGCLQLEVAQALLPTHRRTTHGENRKYNRTPEHVCWWAMVQRCEDKNQVSYSDYGGRGIKICERWRRGENEQSGYECFLADMGRKPSSEHQIDRINNDGNYEPNNCRWATRSENARNKRRRKLMSRHAYSFFGIITV